MSEIPLYSWRCGPCPVYFAVFGIHPHGRLRAFHQKSTCPDAINFKAVCGTNLVTLPPKIGRNETVVQGYLTYNKTHPPTTLP